MEKTLREVCAELQISRRAVQGYEKMGLVTPSGKNKYGYLLYGEEEVRMIRRIHFYQRIGFSLREIKALRSAERDAERAALLTRARELEKKREELGELIQQIMQTIETL